MFTHISQYQTQRGCLVCQNLFVKPTILVRIQIILYFGFGYGLPQVHGLWVVCDIDKYDKDIFMPLCWAQQWHYLIKNIQHLVLGVEMFWYLCFNAFFVTSEVVRVNQVHYCITFGPRSNRSLVGFHSLNHECNAFVIISSCCLLHLTGSEWLSGELGNLGWAPFM